MSSGSIGRGLRRSVAMKATSAATPRTIAPTTSADPAPLSDAWISANVTPARPTVASTDPGTSRLPPALASRLSGT